MKHHSFASWPKTHVKQEAVAPATPSPTHTEPVPNYSALLKRELLELAEGLGVEVSSRATKAEIIAALVARDG